MSRPTFSETGRENKKIKQSSKGKLEGLRSHSHLKQNRSDPVCLLLYTALLRRHTCFFFRVSDVEFTLRHMAGKCTDASKYITCDITLTNVETPPQMMVYRCHSTISPNVGMIHKIHTNLNII